MSLIKTHEVNGITVNEYTVELELSSDELKQERLLICEPCEKRNNDSCSECSCFLSTRVAYIDSFCPIGKW